MPRVCITVPGKNAQPYRFSLDRKVVRLGRAGDNDLVIETPSVSSYHCEMHRIEGGYVLKDSDSTNGIKLDGTRMEVIDLVNDCEVHVGDAELDFELTKEEIEILGKEEHSAKEQAKLPPTKKKKKAEPVDEAAPPKEAAYRPAPVVSGGQLHGGANFAISMALLALAILSFYFGMATRHQAKTGNSLLQEIMGTTAPAEAPGEETEEPPSTE